MPRLARILTHQQNFLGPAIIVFISANIANVANLAFNMLFARLMSPAEFADLTLLTSIKLGLLSIFSALQFGVSEITAKSDDQSARHVAVQLSKHSFLFSIPLCFILLIAAEFIANLLNFPDISSLICLFLAIPFFLPMIIFRGLAQGQMHLPKMVGSFQAEWIIRLFGCWLMWIAGFGLTGITIALIISVIGGIVFTMDKADLRAFKSTGKGDIYIIKTTLPYAAIFLAQVLALDGDIFIAKVAFSNDVAGGAAGLLLVQRIFFFAFLSFATIIQPFIVSQTHSEKEVLQSLLKLLAVVASISGCALSVIAIKSDLFVVIFLGANYAHLAPLVLTGGTIGAVMVGVQLIIVASLARGIIWTPVILIALALIYYLGVFIMMKVNPELDYIVLLRMKLTVFGVGLLMVGSVLLKRASV